jgi:hypothetical protein
MVQKAQATASFPVTTTKDQIHQKTKSMVKIISSSAIAYSGAHIPVLSTEPNRDNKIHNSGTSRDIGPHKSSRLQYPLRA